MTAFRTQRPPRRVPHFFGLPSRLTLPQLKVELALYLFGQGRLSLGKARELAGLSLWEFRQFLGSRRIEPQYDLYDLEQEAATLRELGQPEGGTSTKKQVRLPLPVSGRGLGG